ncbi:MAG: murein biosynthesis integral membrane protein MurJ, partial [Cellulomonadaceae bacterium]|nr:murein biosynthesis integral membrane protein MurJ [Cellulomonadaceae bacterium]
MSRSAGLMAAGTAVSRVTGVVRGAVLVGAVGVNAVAADAFAVANWLPTMLSMLVAGGVLNAVLVPAVVRAYRTDKGQEFVDRLLSLALVLLLGITILLTAGAPLIVRLSTGSGHPETTALATAFALWCIPQVFFYGLYTLLGQILNARGSFGPYMWAPVANNVVSIVGFTLFMVLFGRHSADGPLSTTDGWEPHHIALLGGVATLGIVAQALVLMIPLHRSGFRFHPRWDWRGAGLGGAGRVAGWTFAALVIGQIGALVVTRVAQTAGAVSGNAPDVAGNAAYNNAFAVFILPNSLVTISLLTALFTQLSAHAAAQEVDRVRADVSYGLRTITAFTVIASAVLMVLAVPLVRVVLPATSPAEAGSLAPIIVALTSGLTAVGIWSLCQRVYYAYEDTKGLFWIQVTMAGVVMSITVASAQLLPVRWWVAGAGVAIAVSYVLGAVWGIVQVRRRVGGHGGRSLGVLVRSCIAGLVASAVGWPVARLFGDPTHLGFARATLVCIVVGTVMLALYVVALRLMKVTELENLARPLLARLTRTMGVPARGRDRLRGASRGGDRLDVVVGRGTLLARRYRLDQPVPTDLPGVDCWHAQDQILDRPVRALVLREGRVRQAQDAARRAALVTDPRLLRILDV